MIPPATLLSQPASCLSRWTRGITVAPVAAGDGHSIHYYYLSCPESPDGQWVLYFHSRTADAHTGELRIQHRRSGEVRILTRIHAAEDAHRVACQQWISGGRRVLFHDCREGRWIVATVDIETGRETVLARDRQAGSGRPERNLVPVYGLHWEQTGETDLRILDAETGEPRSVLTAKTFAETFAKELNRDPEFRGNPTSLFFPVLSPDAKRIFFKIATPRGIGPDGVGVSVRKWFIGYDLALSRFLFLRDDWLHPSWHPDSRHILQGDNRLIDSHDGSERVLEGFPRFWGSHPSLSPDANLFTTDVLLEFLEAGAKDSRGVLVGSMRGREYRVIHRFDDSHGATSWRRPHPHPTFSHDGQRLYFNISSSQWTRLHVAEARAT